jgi:hypothetical protein
LNVSALCAVRPCQVLEPVRRLVVRVDLREHGGDQPLLCLVRLGERLPDEHLERLRLRCLVPRRAGAGPAPALEQRRRQPELGVPCARADSERVPQPRILACSTILQQGARGADRFGQQLAARQQHQLAVCFGDPGEEREAQGLAQDRGIVRRAVGRGRQCAHRREDIGLFPASPAVAGIRCQSRCEVVAARDVGTACEKKTIDAAHEFSDLGLRNPPCTSSGSAKTGKRAGASRLPPSTGVSRQPRRKRVSSPGVFGQPRCRDSKER